MPSQLKEIYRQMVAFAQFSILQLNRLIALIFSFSDPKPHSIYFSELGYESSSLLENVGELTCYLTLYGALAVVGLVSYRLPEPKSKV